MAIYHLTAKIVSRANGQSVVASAAYRSGTLLHDERINQAFDYTKKRGIEHAEILAPDNAPSWVNDRERLWNAVEKVERRKDAQLAREIEIALPVELSPDDQVQLARDFAKRMFVSQGMVADLAIHRDNPENPHAHLLLTTRDIGLEGFGPKNRKWNRSELLLQWRQSWAEIQNEHLARAGLDVHVDHRTLEAQGSRLEPGRKIGIGKERQTLESLPKKIAERVEQQRRIARENGERIIADPTIALQALTHHQATFSDHDLVKWLNTRTDGAEQFAEAHLRLTASSELVLLGRDDRGRPRYTSQEMLDLERNLFRRAAKMESRKSHSVASSKAQAALSRHDLSEEQRGAFQSLTEEGDLKALIGVAGSGKSRLLAAAREAWEAEGYRVRGMALSGIAAENLTVSSGIDSRTIASFEYAWRADRDQLTSDDVLVIDEAGLVGTRQLSRVLEAAERARAKVVLVGDTEQLQAIEAGAAFRGIVAQAAAAALTEVRRQSESWQRLATQDLAKGGTAAALAAYRIRGHIKQYQTGDEARSFLLEQWAKDGTEAPEESHLMLAYTRDDVRRLNELARARRQERGELKRGEEVETERGRKEFAAGERIYFLRNERSLGVKNGTLGTVEQIRNGMMQVRLDGEERRLVVDTHLYRDLDYGYAATVYKSQGVTVDRTYLLATSHYDRHSTYVALSRHRKEASVFYAADDFRAPWQPEKLTAGQAQQRFIDVLARARSKDLAHDYLEAEAVPDGKRLLTRTYESIEELQQRAVERWRTLDRTRRSAVSHTPSRQHSNDLGHNNARDDVQPDIDL